MVLFVERLIVSPRVRYPCQCSIQVIGPAMIRTDKNAGVAALRWANSSPTMGATIQQNRDLLILPSYHDHRLLTDKACHKVPRLGNLAVVTDKHPAAIKNLLHLLRENARVGIE